MPTLIPTIPGLMEKLGGSINAMSLLSSLVNTSFAAAVSPLSAGRRHRSGHLRPAHALQ
jgi:hypothetical protein